MCTGFYMRIVHLYSLFRALSWDLEIWASLSVAKVWSWPLDMCWLFASIIISTHKTYWWFHIHQKLTCLIIIFILFVYRFWQVYEEHNEHALLQHELPPQLSHHQLPSLQPLPEQQPLAEYLAPQSQPTPQYPIKVPPSAQPLQQMGYIQTNPTPVQVWFTAFSLNLLSWPVASVAVTKGSK